MLEAVFLRNGSLPYVDRKIRKGRKKENLKWIDKHSLRYPRYFNSIIRQIKIINACYYIGSLYYLSVLISLSLGTLQANKAIKDEEKTASDVDHYVRESFRHCQEKVDRAHAGRNDQEEVEENEEQNWETQSFSFRNITNVDFNQET